jgi:hypothetical protein
MVWYMLRVEDGFNFDTIGSAFGMDHSSVVKAVQYVEDQINSNPNGLYKPLVKYLAEITIRDFCGKKLNYWSVPGLLENYHRLRTN